MANAHSDNDYFTVVFGHKTKKARYAKQYITDNADSYVIDFGTWIHYCKAGVPQALEAMFSQHAVIDKIAPFRNGFYVGTPVAPTYLRTIKSFAIANDYKRKRHALRLALNLRSIIEYGRFNPTLNKHDIEMISCAANRTSSEVHEIALDIVWQDW